MKGSEVFPSKWLKAEDIADQGDLTVTVDGVEMQEFKDPQTKREDHKPCMTFREEVKPLIVNKTNWRLIADILGSDDSDDWVGHKITLFVMEVESFGDIVQAIRVRKPRVAAAAKPGARPAMRQQAPASEREAADAGADEKPDIPFA
jgi:hypothetical protein